jgi:hypothetical protein
MATATVPTIRIGDVVALNADGEEFGREGVCEVVTHYTYKEGDDRPFTDEREFFKEGATGKVIDERPGVCGTMEHLVRFDGDPIDERAWWMFGDELTVKEEA